MVYHGIRFKDLREANLMRLPLFKNAQGEPAHTEADGSDWSDADWLQAVVGELGELANVMKKVKRGDFDQVDALQDIADELADVTIYLDILAYRLGVDLGQAVQDKFNRTSKRVNVGVRLAAYDGGVWDTGLGEIPPHVRMDGGA